MTIRAISESEIDKLCDHCGVVETVPVGNMEVVYGEEEDRFYAFFPPCVCSPVGKQRIEQIQLQRADDDVEDWWAEHNRAMNAVVKLAIDNGTPRSGQSANALSKITVAKVALNKKRFAHEAYMEVGAVKTPIESVSEETAPSPLLPSDVVN